MPTIEEEAVLGEFFDFNSAVSDGFRDQDVAVNAAFDSLSHTADSDLGHNLSCEVDYPDFSLEEAPEQHAEDYSNFSKWIPRFVQPDEPCSYCRERQLQCYLSYGKVTCTACDTLFRPCSFVKSHGHGASLETPDDAANKGLLDTLHTVTEDCTKDEGELTGVRPLKSKPDASKKAAARFPRSAVKVLKDWLREHPGNPYPTEDEKTYLGQLTGLRLVQVNNWLANARRRGKVGKNNGASEGPSGVQPTAAIGIPASANINITNWSNLNPLERWKHSPPQNEPAPMTAIADALGRGDLPAHEDESSSPSTLGYHGFESSRDSSHSNRRAPSMTSVERSTSISGTSSAAWSGSRDSLGSFGSFASSLSGKRERRRRRKMPAMALNKQSESSKKRIFQCTFCTDTFTSKYDWTRHEKTLHLSLEKFVCCPLGPETLDGTSGQRVCAYCCAPEPTKDHIETHNHQSCVEKGLDSKTFYRKDHLRQHLRLVHDSKLLPHMESWKVTMTSINSRCGFCDQRFTAWSERNDHLAAHFKDGAKMKDWKGCRGLDPAVAALVSTAMPPYLIGQDSLSLDPFSATNPKRCMVSQVNLETGEGPSTCWEILTVRLGRYAKEQTDKGVVLTDEMLQTQARILLYDSDDTWNQTAADNPEWLDLFKRAHALDYIPREISGTGKNIPEDLEWYGDLGMRIPFRIQQQRAAKFADRELPQLLPDSSTRNEISSITESQQTSFEPFQTPEFILDGMFDVSSKASYDSNFAIEDMDLSVDATQSLYGLERNESTVSSSQSQSTSGASYWDYSRFPSISMPQDHAALSEIIPSLWLHPNGGIHTSSTSARSSLSQTSPYHTQGSFTPADFHQFDSTGQTTRAQPSSHTHLDAISQNTPQLPQSTNSLIPQASLLDTEASVNDPARYKNALLPSEHTLRNITPQQARHQLRELNAAMAGIASTTTPAHETVLPLPPPTTAPEFLSGASAENSLAMAYPPYTVVPRATGFDLDASSMGVACMPVTTAEHVAAAMSTDLAMPDVFVDFQNVLDSEDMDFEDMGF